MHVKPFLHKLLSSVMHLKRLATLCMMVEAVLMSKKLSVTGLGRALMTPAYEKSNINRADRFIGNEKLHDERLSIMTVNAHLIIGNKCKAWILVDWTKVPNTNEYILRAALVAKGRALVLYEEVHPKKYENNHSVHKKFLKTLKELLPTECKPVIVTDAGFHNPWFKEVKANGFDYVGRIRQKKRYRLQGEKEFKPIRSLHRLANRQGAYIGEVRLCLDQGIDTHLYMIKEEKKPKRAGKRYVKKRGCTTEKKYKESANEPWLIVTSLDKGYCTEKKIFKIYKTRMQIEEGIRDLKSSRYGFSFEEAKSKGATRIENLLLIAMLASLIAWITGFYGEKMKWHYKFQANSLKTKRVLSLFFLGCRLIQKDVGIPIKKFFEIFEENFLEAEHV